MRLPSTGSLAYCVHDKDVDEQNEEENHVHLILVFSNTTTYNHTFKFS